MDFFINMTDGISNHFTVREDANAISGVDWPRTLPELARRVCRNGPQRGRLEINAHGEPASINLQPSVKHANLAHFAGLVGLLLRPGSVIEILSCSVASFSGKPAVDAGVITEERRAAIFDELRKHRRYEVNDPRLSPPTFSGEEMVGMAKASVNWPRASMSDNDFDWNGPLFCTNFASKTGCRVRAAMYAQTEEGEASGNQHYSTPFGNWEGPVFDFLPDGEIRYVGFNPARPVFRTCPKHGIGPWRLT